MSATCGFCSQVMSKGAGCTVDHFSDFPDGIALERIPFDGDGPNCHDCAVGRGQFHHPGCDAETCPRCKGQAIGCGCTNESCIHCGKQTCMNEECLEQP